MIIITSTEKGSAWELARNSVRKVGVQNNMDLYDCNVSSTSFSKLVAFYKLKRFIKKTNDSILFQYPTVSPSLNELIIKYISKRQNPFFILVHDLGSLQNDSVKLLGQEIHLLNNADKIIVHNEEMKDLFVKYQCDKNKLITLDAFDYLNDHPFIEKRDKGLVCYAGNLSKGYFLSKWTFKPEINIFGKKDEEIKYPSKVKWRGEYAPDDLLDVLQYKYGLVWDGNDVNGCYGKFGKYLLYNNPFKMSMYLSIGIPVICWNKAAIAPFVKQYNCGFTINSLTELNERINSISSEQYKEYCNNAEKVGQRIKSGYFTQKAFEALK